MPFSRVPKAWGENRQNDIFLQGSLSRVLSQSVLADYLKLFLAGQASTRACAHASRWQSSTNERYPGLSIAGERGALSQSLMFRKLLGPLAKMFPKAAKERG